MKLSYPLIDGYISQRFGENGNSSYEKDGLKGHPALDIVSSWNDTIYPAIDAPVYSIVNQNSPDPMKYRAVFQIYDDEFFSYEISYGHCNSILCVEGEKPTVIGTEGNKGLVFQGGREISRQEKLQGSRLGYHLHFQVRKCRRVTKRGSGIYLKNSEGYLKRGDMYYEVVDYDNGYNGCVDPTQFLPPYWFNQNLYFDGGVKVQNPVVKMQEILVKLGYMNIPQDQYGYFGNKTSKALKQFQLDKLNLSLYERLSLDGRTAGPKTRRFLTELTRNIK